MSQAPTAVPQVVNPKPLVISRLQKDHPVDNIIGDIHRGVTTHSRMANFCEHYSFVSSVEPRNINEALQDADWINTMHEELNQFERNQVWSLVEKPEDQSIELKYNPANDQLDAEDLSQPAVSQEEPVVSRAPTGGKP